MRIKKIFTIYLLFPCFLFLLSAAALTAADEKNSPSPPDEASDVHDMLRGLGEKVSNFKSLKTNFIQEKNLAIFKNKIILRGRIYLQKPNKIAWHVDEPVKYSVLITDKSIRQWDEDTNQVQEMSLSGNPVFQNVLNQLAVWFSGDYVSLLKDYDVLLLWKSPLVFEFIPKKGNVAGKIIKSITISVRDDERYLKQIKILEISGDSTTIIFKDTIFNAPIDNLDFEVKRRV
jgi:outer membrane lipoprotein carrier protein